MPLRPRPGTPALVLLLSLLLCFGVLLISAGRFDGEVRLAPGRALVAQLGLTDLALFNEARYTRHPSLADAHAPFQDHPGAREHFPSGALVAPPAHLTDHAPLAR